MKDRMKRYAINPEQGKYYEAINRTLESDKRITWSTAKAKVDRRLNEI